MPAPKKKPLKPANPASPIEETRSIDELVKNRLIACSAGRCEFQGCNKDVFQNSVTALPGNYSEKAHIVAFKKGGARGNESRPADINSFENLMLLCAECHHEIDNVRPQDFSAELLRTYKREHEERILKVTAAGPEHRTTIVQLRATIGGQPVDIPPTDIHAALYPRYPASLPGALVDISGIQRESPMFFELAREQIRRELRPSIRAELDSKRVQHYSVFALAPIPALVALGRELGNKVATDVFQRHRDHTWRWREEGPIVEYEFHRLREGTDASKVALQFSLSGKIAPTSIPPEIDDRFSLYEITLALEEPGVEFLRRREDLAAFRKIYRDSLEALSAEHGHLHELHLFLAAPAPVAIVCGMEVMPKAQPALVLYDNVKGLFRPAITVNTENDL